MSVHTPGENNQDSTKTTMGNAFSNASGSVGSSESAQTKRPAASSNAGGSGGGGSNNNAGGGGGRRETPRRGNLLNINSSMARPIARQTSGETVQALVKAINTEMETSINTSFKDNFSVHVLERGANMIALSTIMVCLNLSHNGDDFALVYSLVVEASGPSLAPRSFSFDNQQPQVEIDRVAGDCIDRTLWEREETYLRQLFGRKDIKLINAGAMVVPKELNPAEDKSHVHAIVFNATQALFTVMDNDVTKQEAALSISMIETGINLTANLRFRQGTETDLDSATGLPIRSDVTITLQGTSGSAGPANQNLHEQVVELTHVNAYVDLVYVAPPPPGFGQQRVTQCYYPRIVITDMDTMINAITPETQLLALSTAMLLGRNSNWIGSFMYGNYNNKQGHDLRDIGALGFELKMVNDAAPERIDTSGDFNNQNRYQLITAAIHDSPIYSFDVEENGELSWLNMMFFQAANGNIDAYQAIVTAADNLTDGHFSRIWNGSNDPICSDDNNRIPLGYFVDPAGIRRDLRHIDYLAVLNLAGETDMKVVVDYSDTFDRMDLPDVNRLHNRIKILKAVTQQNAVIKGYARRITFMPNFLIALSQAAASAGLQVRTNNVNMDYSANSSRGTYAAQDFAVNSTRMGNVFNWGTSQYGNMRGMAQPYSRFGN